MIKKITLYKQSMRGDDHMVIATPENYNPKSQRILVSVNNKVAEATYNPETKNVTAKLDVPSTNANHPPAATLPQNPDMRVKVFVYDFTKDRILEAKLQEFKLNTQNYTYHSKDEMVGTSPVILGNWDKKGLVEEAQKEEKIEKLLIKKIAGPENVFEEKEYEFKIVEWSKKDVSLTDVISKIKWGYKIDDGKLVYIKSKASIDKKKQQIILKWKAPKTEGSKITVYAWIEHISEEIKVNANIIKFPFYFDRYKLKGMNQDMSRIADDLCYGDGVKKTEHFRYTKKEIEDLGSLMKDYTMTSPTKSLWNDLTSMITNFFSVGELEDVALTMIDRFKKNIGGEFSNTILTKKVLAHFSTQEFCKNVEKGIKEKLNFNNGNIEYLFDDENSKNSNRYGRPQFSTTKDKFAGGLTICVNDTWAYEVLITSCKTVDNINFSISYKIILYDNFGLDYPDLKDRIYYDLAGFRAWFVLQHLKNFKPFITKIDFDKSFKFILKTKQ